MRDGNNSREKSWLIGRGPRLLTEVSRGGGGPPVLLCGGLGDSGAVLGDRGRRTWGPDGP